MTALISLISFVNPFFLLLLFIPSQPYFLYFPILICSIWESIGSTGSVYSGFGKLVYTVPAVNRVKIGRLHDDNAHQMV